MIRDVFETISRFGVSHTVFSARTAANAVRLIQSE